MVLLSHCGKKAATASWVYNLEAMERSYYSFMMRMLILLFLAAILPNSIWACKCATYGMSTRHFLNRSDYCALIRIKSTPNIAPVLVGEENGNKIYMIEAPDWVPIQVEVVELFKGDSNITALLLGEVLSSCDLEVDAGEQWIVFLRKNKDGQFTLSACTGSKRFRSSEVLKDERVEDKSILDSLRVYTGLGACRFVTLGREWHPRWIPDSKKEGECWYVGSATCLLQPNLRIMRARAVVGLEKYG